MAVLLLTGAPVNWFKPPKATTKVMWSQRTTDGKRVYGSFRCIAWLDRINYLAKKRFGRGILVYQGPYNRTIRKSAGTHDYSEVFDLWIPGVSGGTQQSFFRANGGGFFHRTPAQGFMEHEHGFVLPPVVHRDVNKRWWQAGFKVGYLIDGGWSTSGRKVSSSQIADYYAKPPRDALKDHDLDRTWRPADLDHSVFNLHDYIERKQAALRAKAARAA